MSVLVAVIEGTTVMAALNAMLQLDQPVALIVNAGIERKSVRELIAPEATRVLQGTS